MHADQVHFYIVTFIAAFQKRYCSEEDVGKIDERKMNIIVTGVEDSVSALTKAFKVFEDQIAGTTSYFKLVSFVEDTNFYVV